MSTSNFPPTLMLIAALSFAPLASAQDTAELAEVAAEALPEGELFVSFQLSELLVEDAESGFVYGVDAVLSTDQGVIVGLIETEALLASWLAKDEPTRIEVNPEVLLNALVSGNDEPTRYEADPEVLLNSDPFLGDWVDEPTRYEADPEVLLNSDPFLGDWVDEPTRYEVNPEVLLNARSYVSDWVDEPTRYEVDVEVLLNASVSGGEWVDEPTRYEANPEVLISTD